MIIVRFSPYQATLPIRVCFGNRVPTYAVSGAMRALVDHRAGLGHDAAAGRAHTAADRRDGTEPEPRLHRWPERVPLYGNDALIMSFAERRDAPSDRSIAGRRAA